METIQFGSMEDGEKNKKAMDSQKILLDLQAGLCPNTFRGFSKYVTLPGREKFDHSPRAPEQIVIN